MTMNPLNAEKTSTDMPNKKRRVCEDQDRGQEAPQHKPLKVLTLRKVFSSFPLQFCEKTPKNLPKEELVGYNEAPIVWRLFKNMRGVVGAQVMVEIIIPRFGASQCLVELLLRLRNTTLGPNGLVDENGKGSLSSDRVVLDAFFRALDSSDARRMQQLWCAEDIPPPYDIGTMYANFHSYIVYN
jgi:hypothetical protein